MTHIIKQTQLYAGVALTLSLLAWSGYQPFDRATWVMEVFPVMIVVPLLLLTYKSYPLTTMLYIAVFAHCCVLMLGGAYSYARVPLGFEIQNWLGLSRNPYDKIGHFMQGLVPALAAREILIRGGYVRGRKMLGFIIICIVLAISACYELIEWFAALQLGQGADEFLGTQGDPWDTQSDMFLAMLGGITTVLCLSGWHNRQLQRLFGASPE